MPNDWSQTQKNAYSFLEKNVTMCKLVYSDKKQTSGSPRVRDRGAHRLQGVCGSRLSSWPTNFLLHVFLLLCKLLPQSSGLVGMTNRV